MLHLAAFYCYMYMYLLLLLLLSLLYVVRCTSACGINLFTSNVLARAWCNGNTLKVVTHTRYGG